LTLYKVGVEDQGCRSLKGVGKSVGEVVYIYPWEKGAWWLPREAN
jgi:hypothetical protein